MRCSLRQHNFTFYPIANTNRVLLIQRYPCSQLRLSLQNNDQFFLLALSCDVRAAIRKELNSPNMASKIILKKPSVRNILRNNQ
ncbi:Uncharacterised protein [Yersinia pseudotuberculosis]|uniref:Uncharacterized protein n=2 Tax=Yersinia pseudotuberculosis complex TaxID=1649845 RepID=A0A380Q835_YERPU|nr:Uncharacterised protein [Yersinia pseudotuberculosis]CRG50452.1 Uncharacterised protein [Yersinia wautersii]SUP82395.1 Uncharacterised protein [Yersinia pseudotuberculosis]